MLRILFAAVLIAASSSLAAAQSSTLPSGSTKPMTTAPTSSNSDTMPNGQKKALIPPAARPGDSNTGALGAQPDAPIEIKRNK